MAEPKPLVILVSIDGFKPGYLHRGNSPTLDALAEKGTLAAGLISSFPSVTFPNHYAIVTGLVPDHSGIVNNTMYDPTVAGPHFKLSDRLALSNPQWWDDATPIWVSAHRAGLRTATLFWPGSEVAIHGVRPDMWLTYNQSISASDRSARLLAWLSAPDQSRADFATLYFDEVDTMGHKYGPGSQEVADAVARVDTALAVLVAGLERLGLAGVANLVIVSDHGMADVVKGQVIDLKSKLAGLASARVQWTGALAGIAVSAQEQAEALQRLSGDAHMNCWAKAAIPANFHYGTHRRIPDIVCLAQIGWSVETDISKRIPGQHGYDPQEPDMWGLFLAVGPHISHGILPPFDNVAIYPLLCHLLGFQPEPNDAKLDLSAIVQ
jgi:predicted AlkP superfamily pyrophosphatase or phosphodiesterase